MCTVLLIHLVMFQCSILAFSFISNLTRMCSIMANLGCGRTYPLPLDHLILLVRSRGSQQTISTTRITPPLGLFSRFPQGSRLVVPVLVAGQYLCLRRGPPASAQHLRVRVHRRVMAGACVARRGGCTRNLFCFVHHLACVVSSTGPSIGRKPRHPRVLERPICKTSHRPMPYNLF